MSGIREESFRQKHGFMTSPVMDFAREHIPENLKLAAKKVLYGVRYPLPEPHMVEIEGAGALFWVNYPNDFARVVRGDYEREFASQMLRTVSQNRGVFLDVGSAQGIYSILGAISGAQKVFAVDPDPLSCDSIRRNLELNSQIKDKVIVKELALGEKDGSLTLNFDRAGMYAPSLRKTVSGLRDTTTVEVKSLDGLVERGEIEYPDIVKIDVEGAEGQVIAGMQGVLGSQTRPRDLFVEFHLKFIEKFGYKAIDVANQIAGYGYEIVGEPIARRTEVHCHFSSC